MERLEQLADQYSLTPAEQAKVKFVAGLMHLGRPPALGTHDIEPIVQMVVAPGLAAEYEANHDIPLPFEP